MSEGRVDLGAKRSTDRYVVEATREIFDGAIFGVSEDDVLFPDGTRTPRQVVHHGGAVAIVALDDHGRVVLINQYRHTARDFLWELPAGILDHPGEDPLEAAKRELAEEVGLGADTWHTLLDVHTAPGFSDEFVRVYLAERLHEVATDFEHAHEEADLVVRRVPLADGVAAVMDGTITNCIGVGGLLAAERALADRSLLRPADLPWAAGKDPGTR